ncbi:uncharacterized protein KGF55_005694 [Candida pseudojiufengensis]|uniref:uncharacterized protein n=1 Tax=Candida pseudojiufengensis TaxID=497109 RepID=UPI002223F25A|nr:uncharacterized protein KGF55_005694 [Candida pseudojiufengensis]KAI5958696.1 hypothetical protein KGF55_005694 [Candida pseudojiufengensis]
MDYYQAVTEDSANENDNSKFSILFNDNSDFESDSDQEDYSSEEDKEQDMIDIDEEDVPERIGNDNSESTVEELSNGFKYIDGFIVKDGKVYNAGGSTFRIHHKHVWNEILKKRLRIVQISKYRVGRIYKIRNNTIFNYVEPVTRFVSQKRGKTSFSNYPSNGAVKVTGATVNFSTSEYVMIVSSKPGEDLSSYSKAQDETPQLEENNTILNTMYGDIKYDDDDIQLVKNANNAEMIKYGEMVYWTLYNKATRSFYFEDIVTTTKHNGVKKTTKFIRRHNPAHADSLARSFGRLMCIVWIAKDLKMIDNEKYTIDLALVNDILDPSDEKKVESITKLVRRFIEKPDSLIAAVFSLFFTRFNESKFYSVSICIKRLNSIKNICKYAMATTHENLIKYEKDKSLESTNVPGTVLTDRLTGLLKEEVKCLNDDVCVIGDREISKDDLIDIYKAAKTIFDDSWEKICLHANKNISQGVVYNNYRFSLTSATTHAGNFLPQKIVNTFSSSAIQEKEKVLNLIQKCTLTLMAMIYVTSSDTYRFSELRSLVFRAHSYCDRNIVNVNNSVHIQTFKNGKRKNRLSWYPTVICEKIVAFLFALRTLQYRLLEGSFEKFRSKDFSGEVDARQTFRTFCFLDNTGRLITLKKFANFLQVLQPIKSLSLRDIRKAITFMANRNVTTRVHQDAVAFMERMRSRNPEIARQHAQDLNSIIKYFFEYNVPAAESMGKNWCKYLKIR